MRSDISDRPDTMRLRALTKREIDRLIERVLADVAAASPRADLDPESPEALRPRPIPAAELVRRVAPFVGRN